MNNAETKFNISDKGKMQSAETKNDLYRYSRVANYVLEKKALAGDIDARFELGYRLLFGVLCIKNPDQAQLWLKLAAEQGQTESLYVLGLVYAMGIEVAIDLNESTKWMQTLQSSKKWSYLTLSLMLLNIDKMLNCEHYSLLRLYIQASNYDNPEAQYLLGNEYYRRSILKSNPSEVIRWLQKAASNHHLEAIVLLADIYNDGKVIAQNTVEAFKLYRIAARRGNSHAEYKLGESYMLGIGMALNKRLGIKWLTRSAMHGDAIAQYQLGRFYYHGLFVAKSFDKAYLLLKMAAKNNIDQAYYYIGAIKVHGHRETVQSVTKSTREEISNYIKIGIDYINHLKRRGDL